MTGIRRNIDRAIAQNVPDILEMLRKEEHLQEVLPPELYDYYLAEQEKLEIKLNNMIWYGNEEGKKNE